MDHAPSPDHRATPSAGRLLAWAALAAMLLLTVAPLWVMLKTAVEHPQALYAHAADGWPSAPTVVNFVRVQTTNSAMAAYAFARLEFQGRRLLFGAFIGSMMLPGVVLFIPNFILIRDLGWLGTMSGMVAPFALMSGFSIFFLRQLFLSVPRDLEEAALLDGAGHFTIFWRVVLPLSTTPLATIAMLTGIGAWNEFFWPFVVSPGEDLQVLPVALQAFKSQTPQGQIDWSGLIAASAITVLPTVLMLLAFGRR